MEGSLQQYPQFYHHKKGEIFGLDAASYKPSKSCGIVNFKVL